jgi:uncharacterized protein YdeI (YjbR/CyaY-like superfamily)
MTDKPDLPIVQLGSQQAFEQWLEENHDIVGGAWLKLAKKGAPDGTVTYAQAVETALCYGWIDGQTRRFDEHYYLQRFTQRRPRSKWSQVNRGKAEQLIADGRMRPPGLRQVEAAQADGRWAAAYPPASEAAVPADLQGALDADLEAKRFFETLTGARRYAFLYRLHSVSQPETRAKRIASYIELLRAGETLR